MSLKGPIIIIEDDEDDSEILLKVLTDSGVPNEVRVFETCAPVLDYLMTTHEKPFIIISDINMPGLDGIDLRRKINENDYLRKKSIPFVYYTTTDARSAVLQAYDLMVQGFFRKGKSLEEIRDTILQILDYWKHCLHPNNC